MPQFDPQFFSPQLFWLVISFGLLFLIMWRYALPRIAETLDARQRRMENDFARATALKEEAEKVLTTYETELQKARANAHDAMSRAVTEASIEADREVAQLDDKLAQDYAQAETRIDEARKQAIRSIGNVTGEIAGAAVTRLTGIEAPASDIESAVESALRERT